MQKLRISDPTLRDGNHAVGHQLSPQQIEGYLLKADQAGLEFLEVGHGNGLGASSFQIGKSYTSDEQMLQIARRCLKKTKLSVHVIPGFATIEKDIKPAIDLGVDAFRIGTHCTEIDTAQQHIEFLSRQHKEVYGVLMMSHMTSKEVLADAFQKIKNYGGVGGIIMDSAGAYLPEEVFERVQFIREQVELPIGFHAHNNLGLAMANTLAAAKAGASILDGTARGFGAGAGNCQLEVLVPVLHKMGFETGVDLYTILDTAEIAESLLVKELPFSKTMSITSALAGIFSGFSKHIQKHCKNYNVDPKKVIFELGRHKVVAGQEDVILEVVQKLASTANA